VENAPHVLREIFKPTRTKRVQQDVVDAALKDADFDFMEPTESSASVAMAAGPSSASLEWLRNQVSWLMQIKHKESLRSGGANKADLDFITDDWRWINLYLLRKTIHVLSFVC